MTTLERIQQMYDFINECIPKNYHAEVTIDLAEKGETRVEIVPSHPYTATMYIEVKDSTEEEVFSCVLHEYMHLV